MATVTVKKKRAPDSASIAAVKKKYGGSAGALGMRVKLARGKGEAGKAGLIAWKRSSGYQTEINAARKSDAAAAAADPDKRPTTLPTGERPDNGAADRPMEDKPKEPVTEPEKPKEPTMAERVAAVRNAGNYNPPSKPKPKATPAAKQRAKATPAPKAKPAPVKPKPAPVKPKGPVKTTPGPRTNVPKPTVASLSKTLTSGAKPPAKGRVRGGTYTKRSTPVSRFSSPYGKG